MKSGVILRYRTLAIFMANVLFVSAAYTFAFLIRFEFYLSHQYRLLVLDTLPVAVLIKMIVFYYHGLYSGYWKYVSMDDIWRILKANTVSTVLFVLFVVFVRGISGFPRTVFFLDWLLCVSLVSGTRFLIRGIREYTPSLKRRLIRSRALIIGVGEAGMIVLRELNKSADLHVAGFVDDDPNKMGLRLHGKKVLGGRYDISGIVEEKNIDLIVIAIPSAEGKTIREMVSLCHFPDVKIKIVPGLKEIFSGEMDVKLKDIEASDLLGRETVEVYAEDIENYIKGKTVLITGGAGSIGSEIARQTIRFGCSKLIIVDHNENDLYFLEREVRKKYPGTEILAVTDDFSRISLLKSVFSKLRPNIVFHAAAFKHVPLMEENPSAAVSNNVIGSRNLIYACEHYGVERFVFVSSDKAVNPTSVMGATKRIAEMFMQAKAEKSATKFMAVRFGNVIASKGSVVPLFRKQIEEDRCVTITHPDARRFFMSVKEAVRLVLQAGAMGIGGEIFILDMGEQINITDFAKNLIRLSGLKPYEDVGIEYIGLRPGEKLYEEVLHDSEKDLATKHEKIFISRTEDIDLKRINSEIKILEKLSRYMDNGAIIKKLEELLPSYRQIPQIETLSKTL